MKILVVDDSAKHLDAAREQLSGHDVTCVSNIWDALEQLLGKAPEGWWGRNEDWWARRSDRPAEMNPERFDVVLTDLLMPGEKYGMANVGYGEGDGRDHIGVPQAYGFVVALFALETGARVAIASDGNHHTHPIIFACDALSRTHCSGRLVTFIGYGNRCPMAASDTGESVKDWAKVLSCIEPAPQPTSAS